MEIGDPAAGATKFKKSSEIAYTPDAVGDFPVVMHTVDKYGVLFMITKFGYLFAYEMANAALIYRVKISETLVFSSVKNPGTDGAICVNRGGQLLAINVDENNLISYIINQCKHLPDNIGIAFKLAQRHSLPGADSLFEAQFNKLFSTGDYKGAAVVARDAPGTLLRNSDTINKYRALPASGGPQPLLIYFSTLLETTTLNEIESLELVKPVLAQGKKNLIEDWIKQGKLTMSDALGEVIKQYDPQLALSVFIRGDNPERVVQGLVETQQFDKILPYAEKCGKDINFNQVISAVVPVNADAALGLAKLLTNREGGQQPRVSVEQVANTFYEAGKVQETTAFLLEALKGNRPEEGHLQTKLLEINLQAAP